VQESGSLSRFASALSGRTALGVLRDGRVALTQVDGRTDSNGLSLPQLADLLVSLGYADAVNLDGGGSVTMVGGAKRGMGGGVLPVLLHALAPPHAEFTWPLVHTAPFRVCPGARRRGGQRAHVRLLGARRVDARRGSSSWRRVWGASPRQAPACCWGRSRRGRRGSSGVSCRRRR
jgi:hypothetical protein